MSNTGLGQMNTGFGALAPYPFEKLSALLGSVTPPDDLDAIPLSIGEPKHAPPQFVLDAYAEHLREGVARYPTISGLQALRETCADWVSRRFDVTLDADTMVQPVNGTREALFAAAQAFVRAGTNQSVMLPNPFYQIYEGAALMAGASLVYLPAVAEHNFLPVLDDITDAQWARTRIFYICSPVNPCGTVASMAYLQRLIALAHQHDFLIMADECYIELYRDEPPVSILNACLAAGYDNFDRVLAFHSLSKRSNLPGLRSGFVAGDPALIANFLRYRTYHGCSMSLAVQHASIAAWSDDTHVVENRALYNEKFDSVTPLLADVMSVSMPPAAFYLWPQTGTDDVRFCRELYASTNVTCVPGSYLSRDIDGRNPGAGYIRISLVADVEHTLEAARRIATFARTYGAR
ncbi:MAG: succinyldiaminopimelate transaminase [Pseudomonadota bacterium]